MINLLFPDVLYTGKMPNHASLKERFMKGLEKAQFPKTSWECNVDTTFNQPYTATQNIFPWDDYFAGVTQNISKMAEELGSPPFTSTPNGGWVNLYRDGQFQERHNHVENHTTCSAIYFLNYEHKKDAEVSFRNTNADYYTYSNFTCFFPNGFEWFSPEVAEGDVIIFPAFLEHFVGKQKGGRTRLTVSSNYTIMPQNQG